MQRPQRNLISSTRISESFHLLSQHLPRSGFFRPGRGCSSAPGPGSSVHVTRDKNDTRSLTRVLNEFHRRLHVSSAQRSVSSSNRRVEFSSGYSQVTRQLPSARYPPPVSTSSLFAGLARIPERLVLASETNYRGIRGAFSRERLKSPAGEIFCDAT